MKKPVIEADVILVSVFGEAIEECYDKETFNKIQTHIKKNNLYPNLRKQLWEQIKKNK